tara:strand:+ start:89 stop:319 length:231 start_codon:yes stop_codon:yes gene_type:complete
MAKQSKSTKFSKNQSVLLYSALTQPAEDGTDAYERIYLPCSITGKTQEFRGHILWEVKFSGGFTKFSDEKLLTSAS